jgi:hypothetical protein
MKILDELFGLELGAMIIGLAAIRAQRRHVDEAASTGALGFSYEMPRSVDVHVRERDIGWRLRNYSCDMKDDVLTIGASRELFGLTHAGGPRVNALTPLSCVLERISAQNPDFVTSIQQLVYD